MKKFCASCNQERTGDIRFCTKCGSELTSTDSEPTDTDTFTIKRVRADENTTADRAYQETQRVIPTAPPGQSSAAAPAGPSASSADRAYADTQRASWDQSPGLGQSATLPPQGDQYTQPGQYAQPERYPQPFQQPGYGDAGSFPPAPGSGQYSQPDRYYQPGYGQPPGYGDGGSFPPAPAPGARRPGRGRTMALVAGAVVVVLAAGGGAYAVVSSLHHGKGGTPNAQSSSPGTGLSPTAAGTTAPVTPTPTPTSASPTAKATPTGPVAFASGVSGNPYAAQVETTFTHYFGGINAHDYAEYASSLDAAMQKANPQSSFDSGYSTTTDSGETINSIAGSGSNLTAVVTFKSMQAASDSPDGSTCNHYTLTLPLVRQGSGYVITTPPSGYASYSDC
ncbi:MAG TPA: hypothetical protein VMU95_40845 [Trebonia sp.]|nr:hypothetical protein [Trebonia sp.]